MKTNVLSQPRLPAEWEPHCATHLAWPSNPNDWPGKFAAARWAYAELVRYIAESEPVLLIAATESRAREARRMLSDAHALMDAITILVHPLDRGWMRDISPAFVHTNKRARAAVRFGFNGWAKYDNHRLDAAWPKKCAALRNLPLVDAVNNNNAIVLEGGAIDANGNGALITTEECLLDQHCQVRNPGFNSQDYEACFRRYLGGKQVIWLNKGIAGDDTHGHVDDICRFVSPNTVAACRESNPNDCNYTVLEENLERLQETRLHTGEKLEVVPLPMPAPLYFRGVRLPASYANFYIANRCVLVPTFNDANDRIALGILGELFPDRTVIGIHAVDLVWGFGTLHCLSHEEPA